MRILNKFKDIYKMNVINSTRFTISAPIMSFQTSLTGVFDPRITPTSGTLIWEVDGVQQETNSPSFTLTGDTVTVNVYANDVVEGTEVSSVSMDSLSIIGTLSFAWFTLNCSFAIRLNTGITNFIFSEYNNIINVLCRFSGCGITEAIDFTNVTFDSSSLEGGDNASMPSPIMGTSYSEWTTVDFGGSGVTEIDLTSGKVTGTLNIDDTPSLTSVLFSTYENVITSFRAGDSNITGIWDLENVAISTDVRIHGNSALTGFKFGTNNGTLSTAAQFYNNNITGIFDVSSFVIQTQFIYYDNPLLTQLISSTGDNTSSLFRGYNNNAFTGTLDLSNWTIEGTLDVDDNYYMTDITPPTFTTGHAFYDVSRSGLSIDGLDSIFASLNTFFTANTPTQDLLVSAVTRVNADSGVAESPTDGSLNTDIVSLEALFTTAGYTFTYTIN
jgi:hypothetical protein